MENKSPRQLVYERALEYAEKKLKRIEVQMGRYDGSQKCQHVARQGLEEGADTVAVTLAFVPNSGVNVHLLNRCGDKYIDNTLGYLSKRNFYYLISELTLEELENVQMSKFLTEQKEKMLKVLFSDQELQGFHIDTTSI